MIRIKCILFLIIAIFATIPCFAQVFFEKEFIDSTDSKGFGILQAPDNGYLLLCETYLLTIDTIWGDSIYKSKPLLIKTDEHGDTLWTKIIQDSLLQYLGSYEIVDFIKISDGNLLVTLSGPSYYQIVLKIDFEGNVIWSTFFKGDDVITLIYCSRELPSGGFLFAGSNGHISSPNVNWNTYLAKVSGAGIFEFDTTYYEPRSDSGLDIEFDNDSNIYIFGQAWIITSYQGNNYYAENNYIIKLNKDYNLLWKKQFGNVLPGFEYQNIEKSNNGNFVLTASDFSFLGKNIHFMNMDTAGVVYNDQIILDSIQSWEQSKLISLFNHEYLISGEHFNGSEKKGYLIKVDSIGNIIWDRYFNIDSVSGFFDVVQSVDSGFAAAGYNFDNLSMMNVYLVKTNKFGELDSIPIPEPPIPEINFESNLVIFPNPAHDYLSIYVKNKGVLGFYNTLGQIIAEPIDISNEETKAVINISSWAAGIYIIQQGSNTIKFVKKSYP